MATRLSDFSSKDAVENVVIFVSDSLRNDYLPDSIAELGMRMQAIAPSTFTASSMPSLLTGRYAPNHKVWNFSNHLPEAPHLLRTAHSSGVNVDNVWGDEYENEDKPTLSLLNLDKNTRFEELEPPFVYVVHDHGAHSPYGKQNGRFKNSQEFFEENVADQKNIVNQYVKGVDQSANRFHELYTRLQEESLLEDTLLIFTSDHGELLGEYGSLYEHTSPMVPELLKVPVVFCGAGLPQRSVDDELISGIDLAPTILGAQRRVIPGDIEGNDLWTGRDSGRIIRADAWRDTRFGHGVQYVASSVWDEHGGEVIHHGSRLGRLAFAIGTDTYLAPHAPLVRRQLFRNLRKILQVHVPSRISYGDYEGDFDPSNLRDTSFEHREDVPEVEIDREKLEALGYV
jgi:arylsulfatase A-like enzyme